MTTDNGLIQAGFPGGPQLLLGCNFGVFGIKIYLAYNLEFPKWLMNHTCIKKTEKMIYFFLFLNIGIHSYLVFYTEAKNCTESIPYFVFVPMFIMAKIKNTHHFLLFAVLRYFLGKTIKFLFDDTCNESFIYCPVHGNSLHLHPFDISFLIHVYVKTLVFFFYFQVLFINNISEKLFKIFVNLADVHL